jgi:hypothetical protein
VSVFVSFSCASFSSGRHKKNVAGAVRSPVLVTARLVIHGRKGKSEKKNLTIPPPPLVAEGDLPRHTHRRARRIDTTRFGSPTSAGTTSATMRAVAAAAARAPAPRGFSPRRAASRNASQGGIAGTPRRRAESARFLRAVASASDPLSASERAEFDLLRRAEALASSRRGEPSSSSTAALSEGMTPDEARAAQLSSEYAAAQLAVSIEGGFAPKKYANVLSEFEGEVDVDASPETCYALWNDPSFLTRFVPGLETCSFVGGADTFAECDLYYQFGDARTHELERLRFMTNAVERVPNQKVHWQSTDGFPCGVAASFSAAAGGSDAQKCVATIEFYCHLPFELAKREGAMKVSLDVEERLAQCLGNFAALAAEVQRAGGMQAMRESGDDDVFLDADVVPAGFGLDAFREEGASVSARAMREAAEKVRARVGRTPFTVEVLKELGKK